MNIYTAVRNAARSFTFGPDESARDLPIGAHGVIGDGSTCALVRVDGCIDWLCMPAFDSPSVFGELVGEGAGAQWVKPVGAFESHQLYDPDTNVLETLFHIDGQGTVRVVDFMPWMDDPRAAIHEVHRRVECLEGEVELEVLFHPMFDYGRVSPTFDKNPHGVVAKAPTGDSMVCALGADAQWSERREGGLTARLRMSSGQRAWVVLSWDAPAAEPVDAYRPFDLLRSTRKNWREWSQRLDYDGPWRDHVLRSALLLKLLMYGPTGGMVAAPTTSLPEWIGGGRNWDYRFTWIRDAALAIRAANLIGYEWEAKEFFHFCRDALSRRELDIMYTIRGDEVPEEVVLEHLSGYRNSTPVRIGNGARDQIQLDTPGYLLDAAFLHERTGGTITLRMWRALRNVIRTTMETWRDPDHGIWEPRCGPQHNVHSKVLSWTTLDRGQRIAALFQDRALQQELVKEVDTCRQDILQNGMAPGGTHFVSQYGGTSLDSTLLLLPSYGFLPSDDLRIQKTIAEVRAALSHNGYLYRYRYEDGVSGDEGAFILCGFWLAEALAIEGRIAEAQDVFTHHVACANHVGLLAEEVEPATGELLGNFPQAFSHMGLINAAARIDLALRLRDERSALPPRFNLDV